MQYDMQRVGVPEEDAKDRVRWRQMSHNQKKKMKTQRGKTGKAKHNYSKGILRKKTTNNNK